MWLNGELTSRAKYEARGPLADPAAPACYTTARWDGARVWWEARHAARLARDARSLGLGDVAPETCTRAIRALGSACFGAGEGVVRVEVSRSARGGQLVVGSVRAIGPEPATWRAISLRAPHPGPGPALGAKRAHLPWLEAARAELSRAGVDEAIAWSENGLLVEGARSNLFVARADGRWLTPPLARGGVAGLVRELALSRVPGLREGDVTRAELAQARELVACNALRGARPIVMLDADAVGPGAAGALWRALSDALADSLRAPHD